MGTRVSFIFFILGVLHLGTFDSCDFCICRRDYVDCSSGRLSEAGGLQGRLNRVKDLFLDRNGLKSISNTLTQELMSFKSLKFLSLSENELQSFPVSILSKLHLDTLKLENNKLSSFLGGETGVYSVINLDLSSNNFSSIPTSLCQQFPYLKYLNLDKNQIRVVRKTDLSDCLVLETLSLNHNAIWSIESGSLTSVPRLELLKLSGNLLSSLTKNQSIFRELSSLQELDLSSNQIHTLESLCFVGLKALEVLNLSSNALWNLQSATFYHLDSLTKLDISHNELRQLVNGTFFGLSKLTYLDVSHNSIGTFGGNLPLQFLQTLKTIDLSYNAISKVLAVGTASQLRTLNLSHNAISSIANSAFANLISLESLDLAQNSLHSFEKSSQIFLFLTRLLSLNISSNPIKNIPGVIFSELPPSLKYLYLRNTSLSTLSQKSVTKSNLHSLERFEISTKNFYCDCNAKWIESWLLGHAFFDASFNIICAYPDELRGQSLMSAKHLQCGETSARPHIEMQPKSKSVIKGSYTSFLCVAKSSGSTNSPAIEWTVNSKLILPSDLNDRFSIETELDRIPTADGHGTIIMSSKVVLRNVTNSEEGSYACSVHNEFGSVYSEAAELKVNVKPFFTLPPRNVSARSKGPVELECEASGDPRPEIKFNKNHHGKFPAASEKRLQYFKSKYYISDLQRQDDGVYTCEATNAAGNVSKDFYINVLEVPVFLQQLSDIDTIVGGSVALPCLNEGVPKPEIHWYKDQRLLNFSKNGSAPGGFISRGEMLVIPHVNLSHSGEYTCELLNQIGRVTDRANIRVFSSSGVVQNRRQNNNDQGFFDYFGEGSPLSVTIGIIMIIVVCCVVVTSFIWVGILYYCKQKARGQTYSYDRSVDGASFILRSATAINSSNLGTKQNSTSKGGESGSISCASNSVRDNEHPSFNPVQGVSTTHFFSADSPDGLPIGARGRPTRGGTAYSPFSQADRHFLSGPLISSAMSYDNFLGASHMHSAPAEHSGASFNSLEIGEAFIAGPAPVPFIQTAPPDEPTERSMHSLSQANLRALDSAATLSRTRATHLQEPRSVQIRAAAEHSEHSTGGASDFSSRVSADRGHSLGNSEHPTSIPNVGAYYNNRLPSNAVSETPSYLRHYNRFCDHNYQPNVNVLDLDESTVCPDSSVPPRGLEASPAVTRSSSHINTGSNLTRSLTSPDDGQAYDGVHMTTVFARSDTPHGMSVRATASSSRENSTSASTSTGGGGISSHPTTTSSGSVTTSASSFNMGSAFQPLPSKSAKERQRLLEGDGGNRGRPNYSQSGFLTTGRIGDKRKMPSRHNHNHLSGLKGTKNDAGNYIERRTDNQTNPDARLRPGLSNSRTSNAIQNPTEPQRIGTSNESNQPQMRRPTASHLSEHDLRSLAVQLSVASQRETNTPPRRDPPRPPRHERESLSGLDGERNTWANNDSLVYNANEVESGSPADRHASSSSSTSQHNSNS